MYEILKNFILKTTNSVVVGPGLVLHQQQVGRKLSPYSLSVVKGD